jgi:hypothetical protein
MSLDIAVSAGQSKCLVVETRVVLRWSNGGRSLLAEGVLIENSLNSAFLSFAPVLIFDGMHKVNTKRRPRGSQEEAKRNTTRGTPRDHHERPPRETKGNTKERDHETTTRDRQKTFFDLFSKNTLTP